MRNFTCLLILFFVSVSLQAQVKVIDFKKLSAEQSTKYHQDYPKLSSLANYDEKHADRVWHDFWHEYMIFLQSKKFSFGKRQRIFVHLHFNQAGDLDIFGYEFVRVNKDKKQQFVGYLTEFLSKYDFDLKAGSPVSQCGEIHLLADSEIEEGK